jgi:hypothetical protein
MDSNPKAAGIFITTDSDYMLNVSSNLSQSTISGIVSIKSGSTLNFKSAGVMQIQSETEIDLDAADIDGNAKPINLN